MKKKLQVFISSTYSDLHDERQAAVSAILKAGHIPAGMELFAAGDESQMETIKRWIDGSDVFMLILGGRYGSIEPNTSLSYTELEYDYAVKAGKPYFAVVIEESALEQKVRERGTEVIETVNVKELADFRQKVLSRTSAFFRDTRDISLAVYETISDFLERYNFKGWVSGDEIPDIQSFTDQINKLREENKRITEEYDTLYKGSVFTSSEESEFNYIQKMFDRDVEISAYLYKTVDKETLRVRDEIFKVNLLGALIRFLNQGFHYFEIDRFEYYLGKYINYQYPPTDGTSLKRGYERALLKDNIALELKTYGLIRHATKKEAFDRLTNSNEFTEKIYRFKFWLTYKDYSIDK